nr:LiaF domain-containing protein [Chitinophaga sp. GbtcB8]
MFLFLQNLHLNVPSWVFSWKVLLILLGLVVAIKHKFRGGPWFIMMLIGGIFLSEEIIHWDFDFPRYGWPLVLVVIGVYMLTKRPSHNHPQRYLQEGDRKQWREDRRRWNAGSYQETVVGQNSEDFLNALAVFGGDNRIVLSKNFQGGDITSIFGGSEVNLTQADFTGTVVIDATAIFGGVEMIVPSNWDVKIEVNTIFGGVEDKRAIELLAPNPDKKLLIKGICVFGGIDIKSY